MWRKIGSFILAGVCMTLFLCTVEAGNASVTMSVSQKEILLGDSITLTVTVSGIPNPETPRLPDIPGFDVKFRGFRQKSFSNITVIVNGRKIKNENSGGGYNFDFELTPKHTGTLTVPSLSVAVNNEIFKTKPFQITVLERSERSGDVFIEVLADKKDIYLGEKILVTFKWYFKKNINNYRINIPWLNGLKGFLIDDAHLDKNRTYQRLIVNGNQQIPTTKSREFYKGQEYMVISFQKILTPVAAGLYTLNPVFLRCDVITGYRRSKGRDIFDSFFDSSFDDFFGFGSNAVTEQVAVRSNALQLTVNEIPIENMPPGYNGAVGRFTFDVEAKPVSLKVGEPVTLTMKVSGSGNIEQLKLPHLPDIETFKSYEPESKTNTTEKGGKVIGEKIFEKVLIPRHAGDYEIPEISFVFFNPYTRQYQTEKRGPFKIHVEEAEKEEEVQVITVAPEGGYGAQKKEVKILKRDIHYIKTDIGRIVTSKKRIYEDLYIWILSFLIPVLMLAGVFVFGGRRRRLKTDVAFARSQAAYKNTKKSLWEAETALKAGKPREFYDLLLKGLGGYLADKLNRQLGSIDANVIDELRTNGLDDKRCAELKILYNTSNEVLFSSVPADRNRLKRDYRLVKDVIACLERVLR